MPTMARLRELQSEHFAEDIVVTDGMCDWTDAEAEEYFSSGGETKPAPQPTAPKPQAGLDPPLLAVLQQGSGKGLDLQALTELFATQTLGGLAANERPALLAQLKTMGVASLTQRQSLASAIAKAYKEIPIAPTAAAAVDVTDTIANEDDDAPPAALPRPGAAAAARRKKVPPLPPYKRLSAEVLKQTATQLLPGEWHGLDLPTSLPQLHEWGGAWLTKAFRASGVLAEDDAVTRIVTFEQMEVQGFDAQGGAGEKALLTVEYRNPGNGLHTHLFAKCPWAYAG